MMQHIRKEIHDLLHKAGVAGDIELSTPPKSDMGDLAFPCFAIAKEQGKNPAELAKEIAEKITPTDTVEKIQAFGPFVNFFISAHALAEMVLDDIDENYGKLELGKKKKVMVEFAHPNTHKAFHIGHLRNIITGESVVRILENAGYEVVRGNYQGDVGMHIAKCMYAILESHKEDVMNLDAKPLAERIEFIGKVYAEGAQAFEKSDEVKEIVRDLNTDIYEQNDNVKDVYQITRAWSLEYFDTIYKRVGSHFDRFYFESEVFARGVEIVQQFVKKGIFRESEGAIIFPGSEHGLHDRVFITGKGYPTYEAKDIGLGELQFSEHALDEIIHVVGKEQTDYFKVVFKALEQTLPESKGKEYHLNYGWVDLKDGKMSSRTGNVVLGEWLLDEVEQKVRDVIADRELQNKDEVVQKIGLAATKYAFLKTHVHNDIKFDLNESVRLEGDSGPYLLYIIARIKSIVKKSQITNNKNQTNYNLQITHVEKQLLLKLAQYPKVTQLAVEQYDPSKIAQYLFDIAQAFNSFYAQCPVLDVEDKQVELFRLALIKKVETVMVLGLSLLGIESVDEM